MRHRLRYMRNSYNGDGSLALGNMYQTPMDYGKFGAGGPQGLYEEDTTQRFVLGARVMTGDGRVFRYAYIGSAVCYASAGVKSYDACAIGYTAVSASQVAGDSVVQVAGQTFTKDILQGGYVCVYNTGDTRRQNRLIVGNNACSGSALTIELEYPLDYAVTISTSAVEVIYSPYRNCHWINHTKSSVVGIPAMNSSIGNYIWIQTWGPLCISPGSATSDPGADAEERAVQFDGLGNLICYADGSSKDRQEAGFIIQNDVGGAGPPFIMLQISP